MKVLEIYTECPKCKRKSRMRPIAEHMALPKAEPPIPHRYQVQCMKCDTIFYVILGEPDARN